MVKWQRLRIVTWIHHMAKPCPSVYAHIIIIPYIINYHRKAAHH